MAQGPCAFNIPGTVFVTVIILVAIPDPGLFREPRGLRKAENEGFCLVVIPSEPV
jgi:hypothetical protein